MFSGITQKSAKITNISKKTSFIISIIFEDIAKVKIGDSIAINGVCLTVIKINNKILKFEVVPETIKKTNINLLKIGYIVNTEFSLKLNDYIGGHLVQGHIDDVGIITDIQFDVFNAWIVKIKTSNNIIKLLVNKGFITIDGMSITIIDVYQDCFTVSFIPHTIKNTIVKFYKIKTVVNLEVDCLSKQIYKYLKEFNYDKKNKR